MIFEIIKGNDGYYLLKIFNKKQDGTLTLDSTFTSTRSIILDIVGEKVR